MGDFPKLGHNYAQILYISQYWYDIIQVNVV